MNTKSLRLAVSTLGLVAMTSLAGYAATASSDTATRPSGNVPQSSMPSNTTPDSKNSNWDKTNPNSKMGNDTPSGSAMTTPNANKTAPSNGATTGGSPENQGTKAPATK